MLQTIAVAVFAHAAVHPTADLVTFTRASLNSCVQQIITSGLDGDDEAVARRNVNRLTSAFTSAHGGDCHPLTARRGTSRLLDIIRLLDSK